MKQLITLSVAIFALATATISRAEAQTFSQGDRLVELNLGVGAPMSIGVSYEQGIYQIANDWAVGVGGVFDLIPYADQTAFEIQAMGTVHWTRVRDFDFYTGIQFGYEQRYRGRFKPDFALGARYYLNESWAVTANINRGFALGVTLRL